MEVAKSPRKRCALCSKNGLQILLLSVPKPVHVPAPVELEPLMFFENIPPREVQTTKKNVTKSTNKWDGGWIVIPLIINGNGEMERCTTLVKNEFSSFKDVYDLCGPFESIAEYPAVFGCILLDTIYLLVATSVERIASLPFGGLIHRVMKTEWIPLHIPGSKPLQLTASDKARLKEFQQHSYERGYYYSDDSDLMYPFPFLPPPSSSSSDGYGEGPEFHCDWSEHLRQPFRLHDCSAGCSVLIRGFAEETEVKLKDGSVLHVLLLGRQNNVNPGPRYLGRGLNGNNAAGNDHFYEYIMWRSNSDGSFSFARHTILRGTIPVHWSTQIHPTITEPSMIFSQNKDEVLKGCDEYFDSLFRQLAALIKYDAGSTSVDASPKLRCISLLRQNPQSGEGILARYFLDAVRKSDASIHRRFADAKLDLVHIDWLNLVKDYGIDIVVNFFWDSALDFLVSQKHDSPATVGLMRRDGSVMQALCQRRFLRINCADSLDRTNLGCFFTCFQVSFFMLSSLGITSDCFLDQRPLPPLEGPNNNNTNNNTSTTTNNNDNNNNTAQGNRTSAFTVDTGEKSKASFGKPFVNSWLEACNPSLSPVAVGRALSELYVHNGDIVAQLYTNSAAMHSNLLRNICGLKNTAPNVVIATQRRFENVFEDRSKFRSIELLLGRNKDIHFPSMSQIFLTRPVPVQYWNWALVVMGIPQCISSVDLGEAMEGSLRDVFPATFQVYQSSSPSSLCNSNNLLGLKISLAKDESASHNEFVTAVSQVTFDKPSPMMDDGRNAINDNERIAVIEFDRHRYDESYVQRFLQERETLTVLNYTVILTPYAYPIQGTDAEPSSGLVKKAASTLRTGLKNFLRGLNT